MTPSALFFGAVVFILLIHAILIEHERQSSIYYFAIILSRAAKNRPATAEETTATHERNMKQKPNINAI